MNFQGKTKRMRERLELSLPVRVQGRESEDYEWVELTRLIDVTPFGARFSIARPTEPGRLLHMTLPMPRQLRCFDHVEQQYRVWALVRNVKGVPALSADKLPRFEVGVAFVGKRPPASFEMDPTKRYEVAASPAESGMWSLHEQSERTSMPGDPRPETRHNIPMDVTVEAFDEKGQVSASESTVTENISRRGAAVFTTLDVARGRFVRLTSKQYGIAVVAAVRARRTGPDGIARLHLEFVDKQWPLEGIE
jgi:PilZ domain